MSGHTPWREIRGERNEANVLREKLIEVVAKALFATAWDGYKTWDTTNDDDRDQYRFDAAAVVDALGVEWRGELALGEPHPLPHLYRIKALESVER